MANYKKKSGVMLADKMRKAVLQSAIMGKLTEQRAEDGSALALLGEIRAEKERLIAEKVIKKEKPLPPISDEEKPFDIPDSWLWVRLGDLGQYKKGPFGSALTKAMFIPDGENAIKVYEQKNAIQKNHLLGNYFISKDYYEENMKGFTVFSGDILISCAGTIGESYIVPENARIGIINQALMRIALSNLVDKKFYLIAFDYAINANAHHAKGSAIKNIPPFDILKSIIIPLPPLAEQQRIVEKLEQIFPELDRLQADEQQIHALQSAFPAKMQASLLQSAISGKLTTQNAETDGNASDLLIQIQAEKQRLIAEKLIKKEKPLPPISDDEKPFDIPDNWIWVRLGNLTFNFGQKVPSEPFTYIDIASINNKEYKLGEMNSVQAKDAPSRARKIVKKGQIVYSTVRPYLMNICIVDREINPEPIASTGFAVLDTSVNLTNQYLFKVLLSPYFNSYANHTENAKGVAYPAINDERLKNAIIPLPPLAEQQRIVEKLDQLLPQVQSLNV